MTLILGSKNMQLPLPCCNTCTGEKVRTNKNKMTKKGKSTKAKNQSMANFGIILKQITIKELKHTTPKFNH